MSPRSPYDLDMSKAVFIYSLEVYWFLTKEELSSCYIAIGELNRSDTLGWVNNFTTS